MNAIEIEGVSKSFGAQAAVKELNLSVATGEIMGFLGTNGAGKTTTINMLLGFIAPDSGRIAVLGADPRLGATRRRIGYMPETAHYYPYLNAAELLGFYGGLCGLPRGAVHRRGQALLAEVGLGEVGRKPLRSYSKGMLQRLGIAQALLHDPDLLILDEPLTGLDPLARIQLRDLLLALAAQGRTVFFSSHELSEAEMICDRVAIMKEGELIVCGQVAVLAGDGNTNLERLFLDVLARPWEQEALA